MCYRFRIISEIRSNNEFSSRETKTPTIRMNTKMLHAFLLFSRKQVGFITYLLILIKYGSIYRHFTNVVHVVHVVHQMPYGPAQILPIDNWRNFKHAFRFLCGWPGALSTHHTWHAIVRPDVYTRNCFSEFLGSWFGGPGQKALQTMNEFTLFVEFCLIPLSKTCSFDVPGKKL